MKDPVSLLNGALGGRYRIEHELGQGGMATVYLADDLRHERKVAFKVLKPELAAVVGAERFLAEIKTTANLQHPHILPLFDSGTADSFLFYVMPFVEGETLRDRLEREKQLPIEEAVRIATDVAEALDAAHEQGVIHRDIKPANILLSRGRPLVADFGIALAVTTAGGGRLTETGLSMGTPYYMSPEQASADRDPSASSDVYSLGCVLYEMLVGEPPFTGGSAQAVLAKILTGDVPTPTAARPSTRPMSTRPSGRLWKGCPPIGSRARRSSDGPWQITASGTEPWRRPDKARRVRPRRLSGGGRSPGRSAPSWQ
jgi:serine/threonine protein kinase